MPALLTLVNHGKCTAEHEWTLEMIQQSSFNSWDWVNQGKYFGQFAVSYEDDLTAETQNGWQGLRYSGSSRSGLIGFISEMSFKVFSRDETFQEVTKKAHSGGQLGFSFSTLVQIISLPFRTRNHFSQTHSWLWQAQASSSQTLSLPLSWLLFLFLIPFLMVPWFSFSLNPKQQGWKGPCPQVPFCSEIFKFLKF